MKSGTRIDLSLTPGNVPDSKDAQAKSGDIQKGDLILRDLGYFALDVLNDAQEKEAYYLSKLNVKTNVYEQEGGMLIELDLGKRHRFMTENGISRLEKKVLMGKEDRLPTRLVIELIPDQVYEQRVRKVKAHNAKKGDKTSAEYLNRSKFNLFVTNAEDDMLSSSTIPLFYNMGSSVI